MVIKTYHRNDWYAVIETTLCSAKPYVVAFYRMDRDMLQWMEQSFEICRSAYEAQEAYEAAIVRQEGN